VEGLPEFGLSSFEYNPLHLKGLQTNQIGRVMSKPTDRRTGFLVDTKHPHHQKCEPY
jgi:hypothetical protein